MGKVEKSDWQRRYDKSIKEEKARNAESDNNESAWWHLLDGLPSTGTGLDLVFAPIAIAIVGFAAFKRLRRRRD